MKSKLPTAAKVLFIFLFVFGLSNLAIAQNTIDWSPDYKLQLSDFQSPGTEIGSNLYSIHSPAGMDFSFQMSLAQFMFTKNFNSKVNCTFQKSAASITAPDTKSAELLLHFAQYGFDLAELYARKFRKELHDNKGTFSDINYVKPIYEQIQNEYAKRLAEAGKITELGKKELVLKDLHITVLAEINSYPDYCKSCKPSKHK